MIFREKVGPVVDLSKFFGPEVDPSKFFRIQDPTRSKKKILDPVLTTPQRWCCNDLLGQMGFLIEKQLGK